MNDAPEPLSARRALHPRETPVPPGGAGSDGCPMAALHNGMWRIRSLAAARHTSAMTLLTLRG